MTQSTVHRIEFHGNSFQIEAHSESLIGQKIEQQGIYEKWLLEHIWDQGYQGVAVDVGACIGTHTLWFAAICGHPVVSFEPLFVEQLRANIALNPELQSRVRIEEAALGAKIDWAHDLHQRVLTDPKADRESEAQGALEIGGGSIPVNTLDSYELHNVCLIKIDVEGMEPNVIVGAQETIERERPDLYIEARDEEAHLNLLDVLGPLEYTKTERWKRGTPIEKWEPV